MPWVRFDDDWYDNPDLIAAGPASMLVWPLLISWCARNLTDGEVPSGQIRRLVDWETLGIDTGQAIAPLVTRGLLQEIADGYLIVKYLDYQPSRQKVLEDREKDRARKAAGRANRPDPVRPESSNVPDRPVPVPDPDKNPSSSSPVSVTGLPDDLWMKIAEKRAAGTTSTIVDAARWKAKAAANARAELEARAVDLITRYDLTTPRLVDALVSPTNPPWLNNHKRRETA